MGKIGSTGEVIGSTSVGDWQSVEVGLHHAICVDWYIIPEYQKKDAMGNLETQERIALEFQVAAKKDDGTSLTIRKTFNNTTAPTSAFTKFLKSWKGGKAPDYDTFNPNKLLGVKGHITVKAFENENGTTMSYVHDIMPPQPGNELTVDPDIKRKKLIKTVEGKWEYDTYDATPIDTASEPAPAPAPEPAPANPPAPAPAPAPAEEDNDVPF
jgi:hypothetical protein